MTPDPSNNTPSAPEDSDKSYYTANESPSAPSADEGDQIGDKTNCDQARDNLITHGSDLNRGNGVHLNANLNIEGKHYVLLKNNGTFGLKLRFFYPVIFH